jgi:isoquinoline 1-oxidoreductase alpha subunit
MTVASFTINGRRVTTDAAADSPLLWVIREELGLTGTKYGCGAAQCGACTVHLNGAAVRSCATPVSAAEGATVVTNEGLSANGNGPHPLVRAWIEEQVAQCGYCQSGQIMSAAALLAATPRPTREQIAEHMAGNLCRCGTYPRIVRAIERAVREG